MKLDKDCYGTIGLAWVIALLILCPVFYLVDSIYITVPVSIVVLVLATFVTWFHRVPVRKRTGNDKEVTAVADGKIVIIEKTFEKEYLKKECIQVSIYMNFFDVHANFWPMDGEISYYKYHPGKYMLAFLPKASELNEHTSTAIKNQYGEVFFKQIAGTFARRIVCYSKEGKQVKKAEQMGIIKFGSRIDMYFPLDAKIKVKIGELTRTCETVIAEL